MIWTPPSKTHHVIELPKLQTSSSVDFLDVTRSDTLISLEVDESFINVWTTGPDNDSVEELTRCMRILSKSCCQLIKKGQGDVAVKQKTSFSDLVTEMDMGIEMIFRLWLNRYYPDHKIIGEEGAKDHITPSDTVWYIDPVDGTTNFVEGDENVSLHIASVKGGKPYCSIVGLPFKDILISGYDGEEHLNGIHLSPFNLNEPLGLGTEYRDDNEHESILFNQLLAQLQLKPTRVKSMGCNLIHLLNAKSHIFYKPGARYWDIIAPLALIYFARHHEIDMAIHIPSGKGELTVQNRCSLSPFSNADLLVERINEKHKTNSRIGFLTVVPKGRDDLTALLLDAYSTLKNPTH